jgi:signal transduction histidine kinase
MNESSDDERIEQIIQSIKQYQKTNSVERMPVIREDKIGELETEINQLSALLELKNQEAAILKKIGVYINNGLTLESILERVYSELKEIIPYNRIGFSTLSDDLQTVTAYWAKTDQPEVKLGAGYSAQMEGSSLQKILETGVPRILNNLEEYLKQNPKSESTALMVEEGIRSSFTCPLVSGNKPVGFIFFSSIHPDEYSSVHTDLYMKIASQLSIILEKGRLVTELSKKNEEIEAQVEELKKLSALKTTFLGMAAHDLRNPIGNIQMVVDLMLDPRMGITEEERVGILKDLRVQTSNMLELLHNLLDVTQIEAGKMELKFEKINIDSFIRSVVKQNAYLAAIKKTSLFIDPVNNLYVSGDANRLRQVMDNFISNAVKYSPPGSRVHIGAKANGEWIRLFVSDEGPGISELDRNRIFQDFARLSARPTGGEKSIGLGLSISRRIIEAHNGRIGVDSEPGHGSAFWFELKA